MTTRVWVWLALALSAGAHAVSPAAAVPRNLGYTFYVNGQPVGRADIRVTRTPKELTFESKTHVVVGPTAIDLTCRTAADPKTYAVRTFSYQGTKGGNPVETEVHVEGDSVYGYVVTGGQPRDRALKLPYPRTLLFEDWVIELEVLLALTQAQSTHKADTYGLVFAGSFLPSDVTAGFAGEVLVEAGNRSMAARKLLVAIRGADPFESHVDPVRGIPVYIRFAATRAEVFLDEVFGENPISYFQTSEKGSK